MADFLAEGLEAGDPGIVIATPAQRAEIMRALAERTLDVIELQRSRELLMLDAEETLSAFIADGRPDPRRFRDQMRRVIEGVCRTPATRMVRMFGQFVDVMWQRGQRDAAIRVEVLWNELAQTHGSGLLCAYAVGHFYKDTQHVMDRCHVHG